MSKVYNISIWNKYDSQLCMGKTVYQNEKQSKYYRGDGSRILKHS